MKIFHGDVDDVVDVSESIKMYNAIKEKNDDCELIIYKGLGHSIWDETYMNKDNIEWLINTSRK